MSTPANQASAAFPTIPKGEVIGRYEDYLDAQKVVDYLADHDFPVANVSIIGNDLKLVERVRGKLSYPRVAAAGAGQGAMLGVFFGLLLMLFSQQGQNTLVPLLAAVVLGAFLFMIFGVITYAMQRGKRDFSSTRQVLPSTWDVVVERTVAAQARQLASQLPMNPAQAGNRAGWGAPTPQAPQQPAPAAPQPEQGQPSAPSASGYHDLDDGRPRYGVRIGDQGTTPAAEPHNNAGSNAGGPTGAAHDAAAAGAVAGAVVAGAAAVAGASAPVAVPAAPQNAPGDAAASSHAEEIAQTIAAQSPVADEAHTQVLAQAAVPVEEPAHDAAPATTPMTFAEVNQVQYGEAEQASAPAPAHGRRSAAQEAQPAEEVQEPQAAQEPQPWQERQQEQDTQRAAEAPEAETEWAPATDAPEVGHAGQTEPAPWAQTEMSVAPEQPAAWQPAEFPAAWETASAAPEAIEEPAAALAEQPVWEPTPWEPEAPMLGTTEAAAEPATEALEAQPMWAPIVDPEAAAPETDGALGQGNDAEGTQR